MLNVLRTDIQCAKERQIDWDVKRPRMTKILSYLQNSWSHELILLIFGCAGSFINVGKYLIEIEIGCTKRGLEMHKEEPYVINILCTQLGQRASPIKDMCNHAVSFVFPRKLHDIICQKLSFLDNQDAYINCFIFVFLLVGNNMKCVSNASTNYSVYEPFVQTMLNVLQETYSLQNSAKLIEMWYS